MLIDIGILNHNWNNVEHHNIIWIHNNVVWDCQYFIEYFSHSVWMWIEYCYEGAGIFFELVGGLAYEDIEGL